MLSYFNFFQIEGIGEAFIRHVSNLLAIRLRFEILTAPVRPCGVVKFPKASKILKELNLRLMHRSAQ